MKKSEIYREKLLTLDHWDAFLLEESGLPGPRGNLELAQVVVDLGTRALFEQYLEFTSDRAPTNSPQEFLAFCGVLGLGKLLAEGDATQFARLRLLASDPRWRTREAVAMALQRLGEIDMPALLVEMAQWATGNYLEQRAACAALCEPKLLKDTQAARGTLKLLDMITVSVVSATDRKNEGFIALRKGLAYCWSVAAAALPEVGTRMMERWLQSDDKDVRWIMRENLKKKRLEAAAPEWVNFWKVRFLMLKS
ncbi:hypothetical protein U14_02830 [Candidatus Moduliflexus flocculans]|uniref:HEAT repeat domain-containing protein n=1 Tax=Candidatus Moduliflexus flocculans TaxID=1499966 RepID=A0A081BMG9_9BACT|nr:hypothetical protein U14_02830 [Candidatus Moduliflexus flocculans]